MIQSHRPEQDLDTMLPDNPVRPIVSEHRKCGLKLGESGRQHLRAYSLRAGSVAVTIGLKGSHSEHGKLPDPKHTSSKPGEVEYTNLTSREIKTNTEVWWKSGDV